MLQARLEREDGDDNRQHKHYKCQAVQDCLFFTKTQVSNVNDSRGNGMDTMRIFNTPYSSKMTFPGFCVLP